MGFSPVLPGGGVFLTLLIAPFTAGTLCGLTGSGSAIIIQVMFRLFHSLLHLQVADNETDEARRILAIAAVLSLTQYPVAVWRLWNAKEKHIRWEAVIYLFPGINILVWVGTFIAMHWPPGVLLYILGVTLIAIALWQFVFQSIIGRKIDDEKIEVLTRRRLDEEHQKTWNSDEISDTNIELNSMGSSGDSTVADDNGFHKDINSNYGDNANHNNHLNNLSPNYDNYDDDARHHNSSPPIQYPPNPYSSSSNDASDSQFLEHCYDEDKIVIQSDSAGNDHDNDVMIEFNENSNPDQVNNNHGFIRKIIIDAKNNPKIPIFGLVSGCVAGLLGGMMGINGPPVILFLFFLKLNGAQLRDTSMLVFFTNLPSLLLSRLIFSVFHLDEWLIYIIAIAASTTGLFMGSYFHSFCDTRLIMTCLQVVILLSSTTLTKPGTGSKASIAFLVIYSIIGLAAVGFIGWRMARNRTIKDQTCDQFYSSLHENDTKAVE